MEQTISLQHAICKFESYNIFFGNWLYFLKKKTPEKDNFPSISLLIFNLVIFILFSNQACPSNLYINIFGNKTKRLSPCSVLNIPFKHRLNNSHCRAYILDCDSEILVQMSQFLLFSYQLREYTINQFLIFNNRYTILTLLHYIREVSIDRTWSARKFQPNLRFGSANERHPSHKLHQTTHQYNNVAK